MLLARMVLMAVTTTIAMKNSMWKTGRRRSFHRVLLRSSGIRQSRNHRTGGNNSVRSFRLEIARLAVQAGDPVCRGCREKHARRRFGSLTAIAQPELIRDLRSEDLALLLS